MPKFGRYSQSVVLLGRLSAGAFPLLPKHLGNGPQSFVYFFSGGKIACHVWFEDNDIGALCVLCCVLAPDTLAEVVFPTHRVLLVRSFSPTLFLHNSFVPRVWRDGH
jgi:hypothetical protein